MLIQKQQFMKPIYGNESVFTVEQLIVAHLKQTFLTLMSHPPFETKTQKILKDGQIGGPLHLNIFTHPESVQYFCEIEICLYLGGGIYKLESV